MLYNKKSLFVSNLTGNSWICVLVPPTILKVLLCPQFFSFSNFIFIWLKMLGLAKFVGAGKLLPKTASFGSFTTTSAGKDAWVVVACVVGAKVVGALVVAVPLGQQTVAWNRIHLIKLVIAICRAHYTYLTEFWMRVFWNPQFCVNLKCKC